MKWLARSICKWPEAYLLALIGLIDLVFTLHLINKGLAIEGNPVIGFYLAKGSVVSFIGAKILLLIVPAGLICYLETVEKAKNRHRIREWRRLAVFLYLVAITYGMFRINNNSATIQMLSSSEPIKAQIVHVAN